jgi:deoxycytidylate deaminase
MSKLSDVSIDKKNDFFNKIKRNKEIIEKINSRSSKELVIAFSGLIGSGISGIIDSFEEKFESVGYRVNRVKLSKFLVQKYSLKDKLNDQFIDYSKLNSNFEKITRYEKIVVKQSIGNYLRKKLNPNILAQYALNKILDNRINLHIDEEIKEIFNEIASDTEEEENAQKLKTVIKSILKKAKDENVKIVTFIDSLKHEDEYLLLKTVYNNMFYMIGVLCPEQIRIKRLALGKKGLTQLIKRDKKEDINNGQQTLKVLVKSDIFLRNISKDSSTDNIQRFVDLILGEPNTRPTVDEFGMFTAQAAAQKSGCISRQVGAALFNKNNEIISTGCNDAPIYGGGHYSDINNNLNNDIIDNRCCSVKDVQCKNSEELDKILVNIKEIIDDETDSDSINSQELSKKIFEQTRLKSIIEFSKAVHAEMDAITTAARNGGHSLKRGTLYCTTFPCHLCATNIIASGITKVYYIEPYLKSLAIDIHSDQVNFEPKELDPNHKDNINKVLFLPFEGVAPKQYLNFFKAYDRKKSSGIRIEYDLKEAIPSLKQMMDPYTDYELQISNSFKDVEDI